MIKEIKFPPPLQYGDTLRIIAPASAPKDLKMLHTRIESFEQLGFKISLSKYCKAKKNYLAGSDAQRLSDLHDAFDDKKINGIICLRGGYGTPRLLEKIDYSVIRQNPKVLCGFSDITALHFAILAKSQVGTLLGPNFFSFFKGAQFSDLSVSSFMRAAMEKKKTPINLFDGVPAAFLKKMKVVNKGALKGWAVGGNLSLVSSLVGTPYFPSLRGAVLFLEEVNEPAYRIDRMLTQLLLSNVLKGIKGIVVGECAGCPEHTQVFIEKLKGLNVPMIVGAPFGHIDHMITVPIGRQIHLSK